MDIVSEAVYLRTVKHSWFSSKPGATLFAAGVYLLTALILHHIYIVNERDLRYMVSMKKNGIEIPSKKRDLLITAIVILAPYVCLISLAKVFPRHL